MSSITINPYVKQISINDILNTKQNKTQIKNIDGSGELIINSDVLNIINIKDDIDIILNNHPNDGYVHTYEIILNFNNSDHSVTFSEDIKWVKDLKIIPENTYYIIIENNIAMWVSVIN